MLEFVSQFIEAIKVIHVRGRIDSSNAHELGDYLKMELTDASQQVVLDLSEVSYMSSAGLGELVTAYRRLQQHKGDLRLAQPSARVRDVLELSGLDTVLQVYSSRIDAVMSY